MRILLRCQVHNIIEQEHKKEYDLSDRETLGKQHYLDYIEDAFKDYKKFHANGTVPIYAEVGDHGELCIWCNVKAAIFDAVNNINDWNKCNNSSQGGGCEKCLENTTWYKKL